MRPLRIPSVVLLLVVSIVQAQVDTLRLPFTALTIDDGLSQGMVTSIAQDQYGFLWFATKDGLDRYDGYTFTTFRHDPEDSTTIAENAVNWIHVDRAQRMWVVTNGGVDLFDPATERFAHVPVDPEGRMREIRYATADANGDLWVCGGGLFVKVTFAQMVDPGKPLPTCTRKWHEGSATFNLFSDDRLWGSKDGRVLRITPHHNGNDVLDTVPPWRAEVPTAYWGLHFVEDTARKMIIGVGSDLIALIDGRAGSSTLVHGHNGPVTSINTQEAVLGTHGDVWITGIQGLYHFDLVTRRLALVQAEERAQEKMLGHPKSCFVDRGGTVWSGSAGHGLLKYDPRIDRFHKWEDRSVIALNPTPSGKVLVGRLVADLGEFDPARRKMSTELQHAAWRMPGHDPSNSIGNMAVEDTRGTVWAALGWKGVLRYDRAGDGRMTVLRPVTPSGEAETYPLFPLMLGRNDALWFGGEFGLWRCDTRNNELKSFPWPVPAVHDPYHFTSALHEGTDGHVWAGTMKGLMRLDIATGDWRHYVHDPRDARSLATNIIFSICADPDDPTGVLWLGTYGGGLNRFDTRTGEVERITTRDGLPNDVVYGVLADDDDRLWVSTNKGIARFDRKTRAFRSFTVTDGLQSNEFNRNAYCKTIDGTLFFGGVNGFNYFDPAQFTQDSTAAPIHITGIKLINRPVDFRDPSAPLQVPPYLMRTMTISHRANMVTFEFATMEFSAPEEHRYQYKLEGFDPDWISAGTDRNAVYTNLDPGTYTFRVRGDNRDGVWDAKGTSFQLIVLPPWWRTWWAYALYVIALVGGVFVFIRMRTSGLNRQKELLERTVAERTTELSRKKDEADAQRKRAEQSERVKQQFLANMSHEIRTPMNAIVGMSTALRRDAPTDEKVREEYLDTIVTSSENLLGIVNEILDLSKIEAGKLELENVSFEPHKVLEQVVGVMNFRAQQKGLKLTSALAQEVPRMLKGDPARLHQVLMNLVGNAIKFTERGSVRIHIDVSRTIQNSPVTSPPGVDTNVAGHNEMIGLTCSVIDTGIGIAPDRLPRVFDEFTQAESDHSRRFGGSGLGLTICKRLVEMQGGTISAESVHGQGSTFAFTVPYGVEQRPVRDVALMNKPANTPTWGMLSDLRILLVEDNKMNVAVARVELEYAIRNLTLDVAVNGQLALEKLRGSEYDLVLMDVQMPVMDGYEATRTIRSWNDAKARIPILAMTANVMEAEVQQCRDAGMDGFIPKPFKQAQLVEAIKAVVGS